MHPSLSKIPATWTPSLKRLSSQLTWKDQESHQEEAQELFHLKEILLLVLATKVALDKKTAEVAQSMKKRQVTSTSLKKSTWKLFQVVKKKTLKLPLLL